MLLVDPTNGNVIYSPVGSVNGKKGHVVLGVTDLSGHEFVYRDLKQLGAAAVDGLLVGQTAGAASQNLYSTLNHSTSTYVRSSTWFGHAIDLTCTAVYRDGSSQYCPTAISPIHIVGAQHIGLGTNLRFVASDGTVVARTVVSQLQVGTTDIMVGKLNAALPSSISFAKILDPIGESSLVGAPVLTINQQAQAHIQDVTSIPSSAASPNTIDQPSESNRDPFKLVGGSPTYPIAIPGDSGMPWFVIVDGEAVLLNTWYSSAAGPSLARNIAGINARMTTLGGGYQLTVLASPSRGLGSAAFTRSDAYLANSTVPYYMVEGTSQLIAGVDDTALIYTDDGDGAGALVFQHFDTFTVGTAQKVLMRAGLGLNSTSRASDTVTPGEEVYAHAANGLWDEPNGEIALRISDHYLQCGAFGVGDTNNLNEWRSGLQLGSSNSPTFLNLTLTGRLKIGITSAPASPASGDIWFDGTNIKIRVGGTTKTFTLT